MTLSRKDTILIAVLINLGLITVLLITALSFEDEPLPPPPVLREEVVIPEKPVAPVKVIEEVIETVPMVEEVVPPVQADFVEITVKRGDSLDRLARANKTTIREIKKINDLKTDRLRIGQVLKIPLPKVGMEKEEAAPSVQTDDRVYYVMEKGDNPWKIAKKFHVSYEQIIDLNDLNETKARALKPGDRIRIR